MMNMKKSQQNTKSSSEMIRDYIISSIHVAVWKLGYQIDREEIELFCPKDENHGDYTTNIALILEKLLSSRLNQGKK